MGRICAVTLFVGFVLINGSGATFAREPTVEEQVSELRATVRAQDEQLQQQATEIRQLRQEYERDWLDERRAEQIKDLIREVLADAETRASLYDDHVLAGWDDGFFIQSADGNFLLRVLGQVQVRYVYSSSPDAKDESVVPPEDLDDDLGAFELSRVRVGFKGHVIDPSWQYFIWGGYNSEGGAVLLDAYLRKDFGNGFRVAAGQFKTPLLREWLVSETRQQFIERSLVSGCLCGHYTQGVLFDYTAGRGRAMLSINDGLVALNSEWDRPGGVDAVGVTGRVEWLAWGDWKEANDYEAWLGQEPMLLLGAAAHYQQGEYGTTDDEANILRWTVDASVKCHPVSFAASFIANHQYDSDLIGDLNQYAVVVQGGVFVTREVELVARYEWGDLDVAGVDDLSLVTAGFNWFLDRHRLKWMTDIGYAFNGLNRVSLGGETFGWAHESAGWRPDAAGESGQFVFRTQVQVLF